jgi:hypothetical protein
MGYDIPQKFVQKGLTTPRNIVGGVQYPAEISSVVYLTSPA